MASSSDRACAHCDLAVTTCCARCGVGLCERDSPAADRRCRDCEADYRRRRPLRAVAHVLTLGMAAFGIVLGLVMLVLATGGGALGVAPLILISSFPIILHHLESGARARFLRELRPLPLPSARVVTIDLPLPPERG